MAAATSRSRPVLGGCGRPRSSETDFVWFAGIGDSRSDGVYQHCPLGCTTSALYVRARPDTIARSAWIARARRGIEATKKQYSPQRHKEHKEDCSRCFNKGHDMKRWLFFVYGVSGHLLFLGTFAYMAGFVGNFLVP